MPRLFAAAAVALGLLAAPAAAAPIVAGQTTVTSRAIQDITLLPGTVFNPGPDAVVINDLFGDGYLLLNRSAQAGNVIDIPTLDGEYYGSLPGLGSYRFGRVGTLTPNDFSGSITNVVQDPTDPGFGAGDPSSFQSGTFTFGGPVFGFEFLSGPLAGVILYTSAATPFEFTAPFDGLPPSPGTVLSDSSPNPVLDILFNGVKVGESSDRRIVVTAAVPEPASLALVGVGVAGLAGARLRRRAGRSG